MQDLSGPYRAMRAAMRCERRCVVNTEMAMRCDAKILAMRVLAAEILCQMRSRDAKTLAMRCHDAGHSVQDFHGRLHNTRCRSLSVSGRQSASWELVGMSQEGFLEAGGFRTAVSRLMACNLTWWAVVLGFQDGMKQQEIRREKRGTKTTRLRKKKLKIQQKPPRFCVAVLVGHFSL